MLIQVNPTSLCLISFTASAIVFARCKLPQLFVPFTAPPESTNDRRQFHQVVARGRQRERSFSERGGGALRAPLVHDWPGTFRQSSVRCGGMRLCVYVSVTSRASFIHQTSAVV